MTATVTPLLDAALEYARRGWYVIPCRIEGVDANGKKITKLPKGWQHVGSLDVATIRGWFGSPSGGYWTSVGIDTGRSGLVVVDLDATHGKEGINAWAALGGMTASYTVATPTGGIHLYFRADPERPVKASADEIAPGVDTRGTTGFVFAPPSTYELGTYTETSFADWENLSLVPDIVAMRVPDRKRGPGSPPTDVHQASGPAPALGMATLRLPAGTPRYPAAEANRRITAALDIVRSTPEGGGFNHRLNDAAFELGHWVGGGHITPGDAESLLSYVVTQVFPLGPDGDDLATIDSGLGAGMTTPYATFTPTAQAVLDSSAPTGPGFTKFAPGSMTNREVPGPPSVYDPGCGPLFYDNGIHWIFGESGGGKTWVALDAIARVLISGGTALMIDYEDDVTQILDRLSALGVDDSSISRFAYVDGTNTEMDDILSNLAAGEQFTISVLDGVTAGLNAFGASGRDEGDVTRWADAVPRRMTGAVLCIDHVVKSEDSRAGYAIGSQAKRSVVTGASYEVVCDRPLAKGRTGVLSLVLRKDKRGGAPGRTGDTVARLEFASSADGRLMRTGVASRQVTQAPAGAHEPQTFLLASILENVHNQGVVDLSKSMRSVKDWLRGNGHSGKNEVLEEAVKFARGWAGLPGVAPAYCIRPLSPGVPQDQQSSHD